MQYFLIYKKISELLFQIINSYFFPQLLIDSSSVPMLREIWSKILM